MLTLKGIIIGVGKIIPGVSGSMLAISLGIYQDMINSVNNFFKDIKTNSIYLLKIGVGVLISVLFFSKIIVNCINNYYLITYFFFIGLILGSMNIIKKNIVKSSNITYVVLFISVILGIISFNNKINIVNPYFNFFYFILIGFIDAITMIVPGISGTATLMALGAYDTVINALSKLNDLNMIKHNFFVLFPFLIGMVFGIILTSKLINYLFTKYYSKTYSVIRGFGFSTIILMFVNCFNSIYNFKNLVIAFLFLIFGYLISKKVNHSFHD